MKYYLLLTIIFLASCARGPEKAKKKIAEYRRDYPQLFKDSIRVDTIRDTVKVVVKAKNLQKSELDSLLAEYCDPDTIEVPNQHGKKEKIKDEILRRCKLSSLLPVESIYKLEQGTVKIRVNDKQELTVDLELYQTNTFKDTYAPCPDPTIWDKCLDIWPIIAILLLIIVSQYLLNRK